MNSKALLWAMLFGLLFVFTAAEASAQQEQGRIIARGVKGRVTYREKGSDPAVNPVTVVNDTVLRQGLVVTTEVNASVVLIFANGATVNLGTDSSLDIDEFTLTPTGSDNFRPETMTDEPSVSKTKITLTRGELVGKVAKLKREQGSEFTVATPVGAAGIRGTTFRIVYRPAGNGQAFFSLTTVEGNVEVTLATGQVAAPVAVGADQEVVLAAVTVNVDNVTGAVTVVIPTGLTVAAQQATVAATQTVIAAVQEIVTATANITVQTTGPVVVVESPPPPPTPTPTPEPQNTAPPAQQQQQRTTSGDGI